MRGGDFIQQQARSGFVAPCDEPRPDRAQGAGFAGRQISARICGGDRSNHPGARESMIAGGKRSAAQQRAYAAAAVIRAIEWRESRRCRWCGALGYESCAHRPQGADGPVEPVFASFPFANHRTQIQVRLDEQLREVTAGDGGSEAATGKPGGARAEGSRLFAQGHIAHDKERSTR